MTKRSSRNTSIIVITAVLILIAELCRHQRHFGLGNEYNFILKPVRVVIYLTIFIAWGISVERRIINRQLKLYLRLIAILIVFWFSIRTVRLYFVLHQGVVSRTIWYGSYIPILMIPTFMLLAALHTRRPEDYSLSKWTWAVVVVSAAFAAVIAANDFHYGVFRPKGTIDMLESWYSHTFLYGVVVVWIMSLTLSALAVIIMRCRIPHSRRIATLPIVIFLIVCAYFIYMMADYRSWKWVFGDYTPFLCLATIGMLEGCIQSGMIPANTGYEELFSASPVGILITDDSWNIRYRTAQAVDIPEDELRRLFEGKTEERSAADNASDSAEDTSSETVSVQYGRNMILQNYPLGTGYAIWEEDITEQADMLEDLENNRREIAEGNYLAEHNYRTVSRLRRTQEQNRLYDNLRRRTASQYRMLHGYLEEYDSCDSEDERRRILADSAIIAAYIKRKGNLLFYGERTEIIPTEELRMCIEESMQNIRLLGTECGLDIRMPGGMTVATAIRIFDLYEAVIEETINNISFLYVNIGDNDALIRVLIECELRKEMEGERIASLEERVRSGFSAKFDCGDETDRRYSILRVMAEIDDMNTGGEDHD